jgi:hypothetical protein
LSSATNDMTGWLAVEHLYREASHCRRCFEQLGLKAPTIDIAQPRWVGRDYWTCRRRVLILMINPGSGANRRDDADLRMRNALHKFRDGTAALREILDRQVDDMPHWGKGRFWGFFVEGLGLVMDEIAFANIAWCATSDNSYPRGMLSECLDRFTARLVKLLQPTHILLSGAATHQFTVRIQEAAPHANVEPVLHYADRRGHEVRAAEVARIRALLSSP